MDADSGQSSNRLFIIIAAALIGLICIGLMGLGVILFVAQSNMAEREVAFQATATPTPVPPTFTPTSTATSTPTDTPEPTPTGTLVVPPTGVRQTQSVSSEAGQPTSTSTPILGAIAPTPVGTSPPVGESTAVPAAVPGSGGVLTVTTSGALGWIAGALLLVLIFYGLFYQIRSSAGQ